MRQPTPDKGETVWLCGNHPLAGYAGVVTFRWPIFGIISLDMGSGVVTSATRGQYRLSWL